MWGNVRKAKAQIGREIASGVKRKEKRLHRQEENEKGSVGLDPGKEEGGSQRTVSFKGSSGLSVLRRPGSQASTFTFIFPGRSTTSGNRGLEAL
ncbi:hypothetical protein AV530_012240 [Patagioenas fasciata monilis]|uniref:Uncharacterized protein n=1 Tax=Patagioenas fasciata monilis TaxID=372326 RepID=A0A1V4J7I8_PATFA|nr:hypothetical protein AV530_012240 [Patagioenas fasciata monilis]